jgi:hypothetical protein
LIDGDALPAEVPLGLGVAEAGRHEREQTTMCVGVGEVEIVWILLGLECFGEIRDSNGYSQPDTRWVFAPLGYVCGLNILLVGLLLGKNLHPTGKRVLERSTFTHTC